MKASKLQDAEFDQENEEEAGVPADVNAKNNNGQTPLGLKIRLKREWPVEDLNTEVADLLIKNGGKTGAELKVEGL